MEKAFILSNDLSEGAFVRHRLDPELNQTFEARLTCGLVSKSELSASYPDLKLIVNTKREDKIPDSIGRSLGPYVVSRGIVEFLKKNEPESHEFQPIDVLYEGSGETVSGENFLLMPPEAIDCLNFEETVFSNDILKKSWSRERSGDFWGGGLKRGVGPCVLLKDAVSDRHLWRIFCGNMPGSYYCCSERFWSFYKANGLSGWEVFKSCSIK